jgi:hypothetical protein
VRPAALLVAAVLALAAPPAAFRFFRSIETHAGWARLELPDDVLDACRPGLPDLRIVDQTGQEVPFAFEQQLSAASRRFPVENLESVEKSETTGVIDRGPSPGFADAVTFEAAGVDFLKPVKIQVSDDRAAWKDVAEGSIFATADVRMLTLRLPDNDRRYLRFRLDDRNGAPVRPDALLVHARTGGAENPPRELPVALSPLPPEGDGRSRYTAALAAANLGVTTLRFRAQDPAFSRDVRVYERVFFRDEVCRRLIARGTLSRAPGSEGGIDLPVDGASGRHLEIEIGDGDSPALRGLEVAALSRVRALRFLAPEGASLRLLYGSPASPAPKYDLARALSEGTPAQTAEATLGALAAGENAVAPVATPPRAPLADPARWATRRSIQLPSGGGVAYLDFEDLPRGIADLRIVDGDNRQVPFLVEGGTHERRQRARLDVSTEGARTIARIAGLANAAALDALELSASAPDYFSREVRVFEEERDQRGVTGTRALGSARWERKPGERARPLRIPVGRPGDARSALRVEIENGDNVPLGLAEAWALTSVTRIDFVYAAGEPLLLLSGNDAASAPAYDLEMLAGNILASPASAASLGPAPEAAPAKTPLTGWFKIAIALAVVLLVFELARTLRRKI